MTDSITRRAAMGLLIAAPMGATPVSLWASEGPVTGDIVLGDENAPVTVIEYASFTCPHCARFHQNTWPEFKTNYIDTGKVKFIMREVYFDRFGLWASEIARCAGPAGFYPLADQFLKAQSKWTSVPQDQIKNELKKIGRLNGLSNEAMDQCMDDDAFGKTLFDNYEKNARADDVQSTPTFIINGDKVSGNMPYPEFSALIDKYL